MTIRVLDTGGVERTISQVRVMDQGGVERAVAFIRVMDAGGVVREVFTAGGAGGGGGGGGGATGASISPAYQPYAGGKPPSRSGIFKMSVRDAAGIEQTATSYAWSLVSGDGYVSAGGSAQSATLTILGTAGDSATAVFRCSAVVGGVTYTAECTLTFDYTGP